MTDAQAGLAPLFHAVGAALQAARAEFNAADTVNANHGDHMVETFDLAARAAEELAGASPAAAMQAAADVLRRRSDNGSAQVYARGLEQMAAQFERHAITADEFVSYLRKALEIEDPGSLDSARATEVLKALVSGLVGWNAAERQADGEAPVEAGKARDLGALFDLGVAYMQAKARGGDRSQVLADAAASASPLAGEPRRYQSAKLAILALLNAVREV